MKCEQPRFREESVGPTHLIGQTAAEAGTLFLFAQEGAQPSPDQSVQPFEDMVMGVLEVLEPAAQNRVQTGDDLFEALAPRPLRLLPDFILKPVQALLTDMPPLALEAVTQEVEALALFPAVPDMGLIRMKAEYSATIWVRTARQSG